MWLRNLLHHTHRRCKDGITGGKLYYKGQFDLTTQTTVSVIVFSHSLRSPVQEATVLTHSIEKTEIVFWDGDFRRTWNGCMIGL